MSGNRDNQGKGIGSFAVKQMIKHAFNDMNLNRIELTVLDNNDRAKHLYEKSGFVYEGRKAKFKGGKLVDMLMYVILRDDYNGGDSALEPICKTYIPWLGVLC